MDDHPECARTQTDRPVPMSFEPDQRLLAAGILDPPARPGLLACLHRFEILQRVDAGGMGIVFLARDPDGDRRVAIKILRPELIDSSSAVHHFLREAHLMQGLKHPRIMPILSVSDRARVPYFVMPFVEPGSLARLISPGRPVVASVALPVSRQIADALQYTHRRGLIHRDLKPANVLVAAAGNVLLSDFGLGIVLTDVSETYVQQDKRAGTGPYIAPEIARGEAGDFRCDIYGFGALLYEMLTGRPPYRGRSVHEVLVNILSGPPQPITHLNPDADKRLAAVAEGAMARELRDRYATMADVLADLDRISIGQPPLGPRGLTKNRSIRPRRVALAATVIFALAVIMAIGTWMITIKKRSAAEHPTEIAENRTALIDDQFQEDVLNQSIWTWLQRASSYQGTGHHEYQVKQGDGSLLLEAKAQHTGGWTAVEDVWVDSKLDLRKTTRDVHIEVEFSGSTVRGHLLVMISQGDPPKSSGDPGSVHLFEAIGDHNHALTLDRKTLQVDISRSGVLVARLKAQPPREFSLANISGLPAWHLRFYVSAVTSAGFPPDVAQLRIYRVHVEEVPPTSEVVGKALDAMTNRPLSGIDIRCRGSDVATRTNLSGLFILPASPGQAELFASAQGYEQVSGPVTINVDAGKRQLATIILRKTQLAYGDVLWATPFEYASINGLAVSDGWLYFTSAEASGVSLYRMEPNGLSLASIASVPVAGIAFVERELWGVNRWPGRLYKIGMDGHSSEIGRLQQDWPRGLAFDGQNVWFLETSSIDNRFGVYAIELATRKGKMHISSNDNQIAGLAIEPAHEGQRLWVSSLRGCVYEIDVDRAAKAGKIEGGIVRTFAGSYDCLCYYGGTLWGVDNEAKRVCTIDVGLR